MSWMFNFHHTSKYNKLIYNLIPLLLSQLFEGTVYSRSKQGSYLLNTKVLKTWGNRQKVIDLSAAGGRYFGYKTRPPSSYSPRLLPRPSTGNFFNIVN